MWCSQLNQLQNKGRTQHSDVHAYVFGRRRMVEIRRVRARSSGGYRI